MNENRDKNWFKKLWEGSSITFLIENYNQLKPQLDALSDMIKEHKITKEILTFDSDGLIEEGPINDKLRAKLNDLFEESYGTSDNQINIGNLTFMKDQTDFRMLNVILNEDDLIGNIWDNYAYNEDFYKYDFENNKWVILKEEE